MPLKHRPRIDSTLLVLVKISGRPGGIVEPISQIGPFAKIFLLGADGQKIG
jgi:hypothetical protein